MKVKSFRKTFDELQTTDLYQILQLRSEVFVVEQECPYQDMDDFDQHSTHFWINAGDQIVAYARVIPPDAGRCQIGRVVSAIAARGRGYGKEVFEQALEYCHEQFRKIPIELSAQLYALDFYAGFGFNVEGKVYLEDGIPHVKMLRHS